MCLPTGGNVAALYRYVGRRAAVHGWRLQRGDAAVGRVIIRPMPLQRRQHPRQPGPFEGEWDGAEDAGACRVTGLSPSGCFVDAAGRPAPGTPITVSVLLGDTRFTLPGEVVYLDRVRGFGVRFTPSDESRALAYVVGPTGPDEFRG